MPCLSSDDGILHICRPTVTKMHIERQNCPTCNKRRFLLMWFEDWYGWYGVCLKCGERWGGGERLERPFCRGWRKDSVDQAKKFYRRHKE